MGIYSQIKNQVSTREVAEHYGIKVNRSGMCRCPFHEDKTPSMKVDKNFVCFGCQEKGDVIRFASKLFGLPPYDAAGKLIADMGLTVTAESRPEVQPGIRKKAKRERTEKQQFEQAVSRIYNVFCNYLHLLNHWAEEYAPRSPTEDFHPLFVEAMHKRDYVEYLLDLLLYGSREDKAFEKLQGHWIIELSEMLATNNAKSNEAIKSFLSRQKEIYRTPYERYPKDRPRQCVFAGTTNKISFLPSDRTGNRRFLPSACQESEAEVFILDDEKASREYIRQMWAEAMEIWRSGKVRLKLSPEIEAEVRQRQRQFMQEDVDSGLILAFMQDFKGDKVCSKQLFKEALHNEFTQPQRWQTNEINDIMNQLIREGSLSGWRYFDKPRRFGPEYGSQKGWELVPDVNEGVSTEGHWKQVTMDEDIPF